MKYSWSPWIKAMDINGRACRSHSLKHNRAKLQWATQRGSNSGTTIAGIATLFVYWVAKCRMSRKDNNLFLMYRLLYVDSEGRLYRWLNAWGASRVAAVGRGVSQACKSEEGAKNSQDAANPRNFAEERVVGLWPESNLFHGELWAMSILEDSKIYCISFRSVNSGSVKACARSWESKRLNAFTRHPTDRDHPDLQLAT